MPRNAPRLSLIALPLLLAACASTPEAPSTDTAPQAATVIPLAQTAPARVLPLRDPLLRADAPQSYTVKRDDTLWGLAQRFLHNPWQWPEIWYDNPQVSNPHRIYPGDVLTIVNIDGQPRLTKKLSPRIRRLPAEQAIPTLPLAALRPFLTYPQVVEPEQLNDAPQVIGSPDGRLVLGRGDSFYAHGGSLGPGERVAVVRPHKPLRDAQSKEVLGYEAEAVGIAEVSSVGESATLRLSESVREARKGDRLLPIPPALTQDLALAPALAGLHGHVISLPDTTTLSARWQIVAIDRGRADGLAPGHVIRLYRPGRTTVVATSPLPGADSVHKPSSDTEREVRLPDEPLGDAVVFLVYERVGYALIDEVREPVREGACFRSAAAAASSCD